MGRIGRRILLLLLVVVAVSAAAFWALRNLGRWLVVEDDLQRARAIVVLAGLTPFRAMEAAEIYRQGWAPEVWLFKTRLLAADEAFARLGIHRLTEEDYDQQVLQKLGVPPTAIHILEPPTTNTRNEFELLRQELKRQDADRVILVTSPVHTRRSSLIWHVVVGDHPQGILRYDTAEPSDLVHWWRTTQDIQDVGHEVLGLINARLGFVANPQER